jgi:phenylpropionate dioxygenase-like ring-hydroxylating dioxygenase large terminal subunit
MLTRENLRSLIRDGEIHSSVYVDSNVFALEMERLFERRWLLLGHESQLPRVGCYITGRLGRAPVVCVRGQDGLLRSFVNRCTHRGAKVCQGLSGQVSQLTCPYHGWSYDLQGSLHGIPLREEYSGAACDRLSDLAPVSATETYRGFIFASLTTPALSLLEFLGHFKTVIDDLVDRAPSGSVTAAAVPIRHKYRANWKLTFENLNDTLHARVTHSAAARAAIAVSRALPKGQSDQTLNMMTANAKPLEAFRELTLVTEHGGHSYFGAHMPTGYGSLQSHYQQVLEQARGADEAQRILGVERHVGILYPGSSWHARYQTVRIIQPVAPDLTEVIGFAFRLDGAPDGLMENALHYCNGSTSAFSTVITDDLEIYEGIQRMAASSPGWMQISRGRPTRADAPGTGSYPATSEAYIRNQYESWLQALCGEAA